MADAAAFSRAGVFGLDFDPRSSGSRAGGSLRIVFACCGSAMLDWEAEQPGLGIDGLPPVRPANSPHHRAQEVEAR